MRIKERKSWKRPTVKILPVSSNTFGVNAGGDDGFLGS
jgi:hypothetical protein